MSIKASRVYGIGLSLLAVSAFAACSSSSEDDSGTPNNKAGTSSTAGSSTGGSLGTGGTSSTAGTTSTAGTSSTAGTTSTGGTGTAGSGTGGSGGGASTACAGKKPTGNLITDFTETAPGAKAGQLAFSLAVPGGTFSYPGTALTLDAKDKNLKVTGNIKAYSGFGIYVNDCYDAAGAGSTGVSFNIKGNVGASGKISFRIQTNGNNPIDVANKKGTCNSMGLPPDNAYMYCHPAAVDIPVTAGGGEVTVKWADVTGGLPNVTIDGKDVIGFEWAFAWMDMGTAYDVDVTVDDIKFTGTIAGGGGSGGTGGGGAGGGGTGGGGAGGTGGGGAGGTGGTN